MNPLAQLRSYAANPKGRRVLVVGGGAAAAGFGLYTRHKRASGPSSGSSAASSPAPVANPDAMNNAPIYVVMEPPAGSFPTTPPATQPPGTGNGGNNNDGSGPATTSPHYTAQDVKDLFARYGFTSDAQIAGATYTQSGETAQQRIDRITRDLNSGARSIDQVTTSVSQLPGSPSRGQT